MTSKAVKVFCKNGQKRAMGKLPFVFLAKIAANTNQSGQRYS